PANTGRGCHFRLIAFVSWYAGTVPPSEEAGAHSVIVSSCVGTRQPDECVHGAGRRARLHDAIGSGVNGA
ncbi:MAG: hypothetical protein QOD72_2893, partial [Acidimicrobiaceae bacterium]|nr:hypothetical protein [Acidimicrobiaceae bacterium]